MFDGSAFQNKLQIEQEKKGVEFVQKMSHFTRERERERKCFSIRFQTILGNSMDTLLQKQITVYDTQTVCFVKLIPEFQTEHYSFAFFHVFLGIFILFYFGRNFGQFFSSVDNFHVPFFGFKEK